MPEIVLSDFVEIAHASGLPKATKVAEVKNRGKYDPRFDFYKRLRENVERVHVGDLPKARLRDALDDLKDYKKARIYPELVTAYQKWWGRKELRWLSPPRGVFSDSGIDVIVNPDIGLTIGDAPHFIKLHFKAEALTRSRVDIVTHLMELSLRPKVENEAIFAMLDVRRGKLIVAGPSNVKVNACLRAEMAYIANIWQNV
jgi:hypothetical protein